MYVCMLSAVLGTMGDPPVVTPETRRSRVSRRVRLLFVLSLSVLTKLSGMIPIYLCSLYGCARMRRVGGW